MFEVANDRIIHLETKVNKAKHLDIVLVMIVLVGQNGKDILFRETRKKTVFEQTSKQIKNEYIEDI